MYTQWLQERKAETQAALERLRDYLVAKSDNGVELRRERDAVTDQDRSN
jgi:hypothetical protein